MDTKKKKISYYGKLNQYQKNFFPHPTIPEYPSCIFLWSDWNGVWDYNWCDNRNNLVKHYACQYGKQYKGALI